MSDFSRPELRARIQKQAFPSLLQSAEDERRNELNWEQAIHDANMERHDYNLRDEGRNPNGDGESYAERNH